ncbi:hypothetical protein ACFL47_09310 [Candidatus Latescibacterota bacterium]
MPDADDKMDAWLARAGAVMNTLVIDEDTAQRIKASDLPMYDAHNYFNDYLLCTEADTTKKDFSIILKRNRTSGSMFDYAGQDSINVLFSVRHLDASDGLITRLDVSRIQNASRSGGRVIPGKSGVGIASIVPMGLHNEEMLKRIQEDSLPEMKINTR